MSTSFTLATLKTAIQAHVEDDGVDLAAQLDLLIQMGEDRILVDLPLSIFDVRSAVSLVSGTQTATKPTGTIAILELYYTNGGSRVVLLPRTYSYCIDYAPGTATGTPKYFAEDYSESEIFIAPSPNISVTGEALITKRPESIVTDTNGTFISQNLGSLLLTSCLINTEEFNIASEQVAMWKANYSELLAAARYDLAHLLRHRYSTLSPQPLAINKPER